jgi:phosphoribosylformimino-5-aminoimidazole carboxamide ribotide isomerase
MRIYPAVDLRHGRSVRLLRGEQGTETVYGSDPIETAEGWQSQGASVLHVVDLDAAFGESSQRAVVRSIVESVSIPVQVGGGVRSLEDFRELLGFGCWRVVFGTVALTEPRVVEEALELASERVVVGLDVKDGALAVRGWTESVPETPVAVARRYRERGVRSFVYTDVSRDGVMKGPNVEETARLARESGASIVASGGVGSLEHLKELSAAASTTSIEGVIVGKALYEGAFTLAEALGALASEG